MTEEKKSLLSLCVILTLFNFLNVASAFVPQSRLNFGIGEDRPNVVDREFVRERDSISLHVSMAPNEVRAASDPIASQNRGDARGAALLVENVAVFRGPSKILQNVNWRVEPRTKWALVGANGAGKSTLLKAIVGELAYDGKILVGTKQKVGYLKQTAVAGSSRTIYEEACSGMVEINEARLAIERAAESGDLDALESATFRFEASGGYKQEQKVANVLKGLGFVDFTMRCDELSGGWQMRVAFARQLLSEPTLALLDEPGNHLDAAARKWLAKYLAEYQGEGAMVLVTHDVELLKSMDHIAEVIPDAGGLQIYKSCNYEQYLELKQERSMNAMAEYEKNMEKAAKLQAFVDRFGAQANKASAAQSRVKQIEKMREAGLLDLPVDDVAVERFKPTMILPSPPKAVGASLLCLKNAVVGHNEALVSGVNIDITKGMKLLIRGPNGSGKSTCLHSIRGSIPLIQGERVENPSLRLGMFTQDLAQELDANARAVDIVTAYARLGSDGDITVSDQAARGAMGRLGLQGEKALRKISELSGGEKARVALAMFSLKPSNVYFLDEPSNHLDIECIEALSEGICKWGGKFGALVVVSHDRNFCEKIEFTHVATVQNGSFKIEERSVRDSDWRIDNLSASTTAAVAEVQSQKSDKKPLKDLDPKLRKLAYNAPKRIAKLEKLIEEAGKKMEEVDEKMMTVGNDVGKLVDFNKEKDLIKAKVNSYEKEWEELEDALEKVAEYAL